MPRPEANEIGRQTFPSAGIPDILMVPKCVPGFRRDAPEDEELRPAKCFAFVQAHDDRPRRRLLDVLASQGYAPNQRLVLMSDGGKSVRRLVSWISPGHIRHAVDAAQGFADDA